MKIHRDGDQDKRDGQWQTMDGSGEESADDCVEDRGEDDVEDQHADAEAEFWVLVAEEEHDREGVDYSVVCVADEGGNLDLDRVG